MGATLQDWRVGAVVPHTAGRGSSCAAFYVRVSVSVSVARKFPPTDSCRILLMSSIRWKASLTCT